MEHKKTKIARNLEGDLLARSEPARDITKGALEELMMEKKTVLGLLGAQL